MAYLAEEHGIRVGREVLSDCLTTQGFSYISALSTEEASVRHDHGVLRYFFVAVPHRHLSGVHPALVCSLDEIGAERYADRKRVFVFLPESAHARSGVSVGIPRTTQSCTLVMWVSLDGDWLTPTVITKS